MTGWLTVFIAAVVAVIASLQWRTARAKLALDLFDRRFDVFMDVRKIVSHKGRALKRGPIGAGEDMIPWHRDEPQHFHPGLPNEIIARSRFLFGKDMLPLMEEVHRLVVQVNMDQSDRSDKASDELHELFLNRLIPAFEEYLRFDAKPKWF
jgi:hypothetical protein